jgi:ABC-type antimicrobial peptide transport system permease subunit
MCDGAGISALVRNYVPSVPAALSYLWVAIGFVISVGVGLVFGYYPANMAANLNPMCACRMNSNTNPGTR